MLLKPDRTRNNRRLWPCKEVPVPLPVVKSALLRNYLLHPHLGLLGIRNLFTLLTTLLWLSEKPLIILPSVRLGGKIREGINGIGFLIRGLFVVHMY